MGLTRQAIRYYIDRGYIDAYYADGAAGIYVDLEEIYVYREMAGLERERKPGPKRG